MSGSSSTVRRAGIQLSLEGARAVERDMQRMGQTGDQALGQIMTRANLASGALRLLGPLVAGLSAGALVTFAARALNSAAALGDMAARAGTTAEALQVLRIAAQNAGSSSEDMDRALSNLTRTIGEAAGGSTSAQQTFARLNISFLDAQGNARSTQAVIGDLADRLAAMRTPAERAAAAAALLGTNVGTRLVAALSDGRQGLAQVEDQARRTGRIIDEDTVAAANRATTAFQNLLSTAGDLATGLWARLAPVLEAVANAFNRVVAGPSNLERAIALTNEYIAVQRRLRDLDAELARAPASNPALDRLDRARGLTVQGSRAALEQEQASLRARAEEIRRQQDELERRAAARPDRPTFADPGPLPPLPPRTPLVNAPGTGRGRAGANDAERELAELLRNREALVRRNETAAERYNRELAALNTLAAQLAARGDRYALPDEQLTRERNRLLEEFNRSLETTDTLLEQLGQFGERAFDRIGSAITQMAAEGRASFDSLRNIGRAVVSELMQEFYRLAVMNPLRNLISGGSLPTLGDLAGRILGGFGGGTVQPPVVYGGLYHTGGIVGAGGAGRMVSADVFREAPRYHRGGFPGLAASEVPAILQRGEGVFTPEQMRALGPAGGTTINVTFQGGDMGSDSDRAAMIEQLRGMVRQEIDGRTPAIVEMAHGHSMAQVRRGGMAAREFGRR